VGTDGRGGGWILEAMKCSYGDAGFASSVAWVLEFGLGSLASKGQLLIKLHVLNKTDKFKYGRMQCVWLSVRVFLWWWCYP